MAPGRIQTASNLHWGNGIGRFTLVWYIDLGRFPQIILRSKQNDTGLFIEWRDSSTLKIKSEIQSVFLLTFILYSLYIPCFFTTMPNPNVLNCSEYCTSTFCRKILLGRRGWKVTVTSSNGSRVNVVGLAGPPDQPLMQGHISCCQGTLRELLASRPSRSTGLKFRCDEHIKWWMWGDHRSRICLEFRGQNLQSLNKPCLTWRWANQRGYDSRYQTVFTCAHICKCTWLENLLQLCMHTCKTIESTNVYTYSFKNNLIPPICRLVHPWYVSRFSNCSSAWS